MPSKAWLGSAALFVSLCASAACSDDKSESGLACNPVAPSSCPSPAPSYSQVATIVKARCSSCHAEGQVQWPLSDYDDLADWHDQVKAMMQTCTMPPPDAGIEMPVEERELILAWIRCGMPK